MAPIDVETAAVLSIAESLILGYPKKAFLSNFVILFVLQYMVLKVFRHIITPLYLSQLRSLPGPKVSIASLPRLKQTIT
jgi:hypothetical protein